MNGPDRLPFLQISRDGCRADLLGALLASPVASERAADPNRSLLASIIAGQGAGNGCLPPTLGLSEADYLAMLDTFFPAAEATVVIREEILIPEKEDLYKLLTDHRAGASTAELWIASIIASACAGSDHLWQDLGLANRGELSQLMVHNFPALAASNSGDMKWKKFLYRQFCALEGIYTCPAPSCGVCADFAKCFGPES